MKARIYQPFFENLKHSDREILYKSHYRSRLTLNKDFLKENFIFDSHQMTHDLSQALNVSCSTTQKKLLRKLQRGNSGFRTGCSHKCSHYLTMNSNR